LVSCSSIQQIPLSDPGENQARQEFQSSIASDLPLLQEIKPYRGDTPPRFIFDEIYGPAVSLWERDRPGPAIAVYRLD
jgi:hypothetical protein